MANMKRFLPVLACVAALWGHGGVQAQVSKADYRSMVGLNSASSGFQTLQPPANLVSVTNLGTTFAVKRLDYEVYGDSVGRLKFFLPPGTVAFNANLYYYYAASEGRVALRLNQVPTTPLGTISVANAGGSVNESVLRKLIAGSEVLNYSPGAPANSLVISSPDNPIDPMATGGYVYGNYQYPGDLLQRGLLQIFVKADCYTQWFNSPNTKWDFNGNPDETATHSCEGSSGGGTNPDPNPNPDPGNPLKDVILSPSTANNTLQAGSATTSLTLLSNPASVALPICTIEGSNAYLSIDNTSKKISLRLPEASNLTQSITQTLVCGAIRKTITILPPDNGVRVEKSAPTSDVNGNLVLNVKLIRPEAEIAGKTTTSYWVAARIPADGFFFQEDEWFFLTPRGWETLIFPNPNHHAYQVNQTVKAETSFTIKTDIPAADLGHFNIDLNFGYLDAGGNFQNKGIIWSKN